MNWKTIIATAIVTGIVAVGTGMLLFYLQLREPKLVFAVQQSVPFQGNRESLSIQHIVIRNEGTKEVANVVAEVRVPGGRIKERRVATDSSLSFTEKLTAESYRFEARALNPEERVQISLLTSGTTSPQQAPEVSLRGQGIVGRVAADSEKSRIGETLVPAVVAAYAGVVAALFFSKRYRRIVIGVSRAILSGKFLRGGSEQHQVIGSLFALRGAVNEAEEYLVRRDKCSYWSESDLLAARAIASKDTKKAELCIAVLTELLDYDEILDGSRAIIHYNIARVSAFFGQNDTAKNNLAKARALDDDIIDSRIERDSILESFKKM
jgi:hypothetical protein